MSTRWKPTAEHRAAAVEHVPSGLARGDDVLALSKEIADLHPLNNTFPGEVFISLAVDALDAAGIGRDTPLAYEGLRERYLAECRFRGRDNKKIQFAVLAIGATRGGVEPDLLDEVAWWQTDDFWWYALAASVGVIRSCAERLDERAAAKLREGRQIGETETLDVTVLMSDIRAYSTIAEHADPSVLASQLNEHGAR